MTDTPSDASVAPPAAPPNERKKPEVCAILRGKSLPPGEPASLVVLGAARGGTSMCAGLLRLMGVDMGETVGRGNNEDQDILAAREPLIPLVDPNHADHESGKARLREVFAGKARENALWGWKDPMAWQYYDLVADLLPRPRFIVIFRDYMAVAAREHLASGRDYLDNLERARRDYEGILALIDRTEAPVLAASYEKVLRRPGQFVAQLGRFIGRPVSPDDLKTWSAYVRPEPPGGNIARFAGDAKGDGAPSPG